MVAASHGTHLILYDGVCGLCNRLVQFVLARDARRVFVFASLQSLTGRQMAERFGRNPNDITSFYVVADYRADGAQLFSKSGAALLVARALGWPWKAAASLRILPASLLDRLYDLVARRRYQIFGRFDQCPIPPPEVRERFIDT